MNPLATRLLTCGLAFLQVSGDAWSGTGTSSRYSRSRRCCQGQHAVTRRPAPSRLVAETCFHVGATRSRGEGRRRRLLGLVRPAVRKISLNMRVGGNRHQVVLQQTPRVGVRGRPLEVSYGLEDVHVPCSEPDQQLGRTRICRLRSRHAHPRRAALREQRILIRFRWRWRDEKMVDRSPEKAGQHGLGSSAALTGSR